MTNLLEKVAQHRDAILLAEIGALIHDLGKLSAEFIDTHAEEVDHKWDHELILRRCSRELHNLFPDASNEQELFWQLLEQEFGSLSRLRTDYDRLCARRKRDFQANISDFIGKVPAAKPTERAEIVNKAKHYVAEQSITDDFLPDIFARLLELNLELQIESVSETIHLADFVEQHGDPVETQLKAIKLFKPPSCDAVDSEIDKGNANAAQPPGQCYIATAFGYERAINVSRLKWVRHAYANILAGVLQEYQATKIQDTPLDLQLWETWLYGNDDNGLRAETRQAFLHALGETRRAANDVTLWDHSYSVASLYKSALAKVLIDGWEDPANIKWRILRVNVDELALYAKAHKVADLLAYRRARDDALDAVKRLIEVEYPLGNEVYRDTSGIYFTFPDVDLPGELRRRIVGVMQEIEQELTPIAKVSSAEREGLKDLLARELEQAEADLKQPTRTDNVYHGWQQRWNNLPPGKFEVCPVCRIRPKREKDDECEDCYTRRKSRVADWLGEPQSTIWIDEVADHNGQVAVLVGRFELTEWLNGKMIETMLVNADERKPKNPSPARIRRVWETTLRFWEDAVSKTLAGYAYGHDTNRAALRMQRWVVMPKGLTVERGKVYDGTVNGKPLSLFGEDMQLRTISNLQMCGAQKPDDLDGQHFESEDGTFTISGVLEYGDNLSCYRPYIVLVHSPDQFIALVPAYDAVGIAQELYEKYTKQFGKVRNRLPLRLGLVYFKRKMPLYAALDAGRRMLEVDKSGEPSTQTWQVDRTRKLCNHRVLYFDNGAVWKIDEKMGDRSRDDDWYPYWQVIETGDSRPLDKKHFRVGNKDWVHVSELRVGDKVAVYPSHFSFLYLDTSTRRFAAGDAEYTLLLDDVPWLTKTWKKIEDKSTQLHGLETLLHSKRAAWGADSDIFRDLAKDALKDAGIAGAVTVEDVISGRFFRLVELYLHIVKMGK